MRADRAEVSWDPAKSKWLVRISSGDEVMRRCVPCPRMPPRRNCGPPPTKRCATTAMRSTPRKSPSAANYLLPVVQEQPFARSLLALVA